MIGKQAEYAICKMSNTGWDGIDASPPREHARDVTGAPVAQMIQLYSKEPGKPRPACKTVFGEIPGGIWDTLRNGPPSAEATKVTNQWPILCMACS